MSSLLESSAREGESPVDTLEARDERRSKSRVAWECSSKRVVDLTKG